MTRFRFSRPRVAALGVLVLAMVGAAAVVSEPGPTSAASVTVAMPRTRAAALIQATSGSSLADMQAVGDQARVINAALPFANGPLRSAQSFVVTGSELDQARALLCLTQAVYYEAGFEPIEGRRAVAQVVLNRLRHPAFPKSICGVVYEGSGTGTCQFTFVCDGALYRRPAAEAWRESEQVARAALSGYVERSVGEATHYHADYVAPRWAPLLAKVVVIGQHIFYRWPGSWGLPAAFVGRYIGEPRDPLAMRPAPPAPTPTADANVTLAQVDVGPPVPHAPDDVGGLIDTSKGWTPNIPLPDESGSAAARMIAAQQGRPATSRPVETASAAGLVSASK